MDNIRGSANWQDKFYSDVTNPVGDSIRLTQYDVVIINLMGKYEISKNLSAQLNVNNLFDKDFGDYQTFTNTKGETVNAFLYTKTTSGLAGTYIPDRNYWLSISYDF